MSSISGFSESEKKNIYVYKVGRYSSGCTCPYADSKHIYDSNTSSLRLTCLLQAGFILWSQHCAFMAKTESFLLSVTLQWDPKPALGIGLHRSMGLTPCQNATLSAKVNTKWKWQENLPCIPMNEFDMLSQVNIFKDKLSCSYMPSSNFWKTDVAADVCGIQTLILSVQCQWTESMKYFYQT